MCVIVEGKVTEQTRAGAIEIDEEGIRQLVVAGTTMATEPVSARAAVADNSAAANLVNLTNWGNLIVLWRFVGL